MQFLSTFQNMSGLAISKDKSSFIIAKSVNQARINAIKSECGFNCVDFPIKYLGTPIYKGRKKKLIFEESFSMFQRKIATWHSNFLSFSGRLVLIKSVLNSIPIFIFHTLNPSMSICRRLERIINKFFLGS
ncbi:Putative ribonuclease H protein [Dendrobium catenatum]|uniref:Ribonuclease H protein n=1 Tax=Dendrobium catenatum TaxID=906689 RepID=A0A2I0WYW7_9ASPA|nr:Putative ribonuclease H protein [Dendrobium catenatum]